VTIKEKAEMLLDCVNELCLFCRKYEWEHDGACEGCKWYKVKCDE